MAYIGKQPLVGNYTVLDALTATTTATYALTKNSVAVFPQTPANCIVSLNGVIQAPFDSYTISGSNIVFASALTGSDSIDFITVLGDVLNVGTVSDGTITTAKLASGVLPTNTPAFSVYKSSTQSLTSNVFTKVTFDTETYDIGNCFASSRFTPTTTGYYFIHSALEVYGTGATRSTISIYKNGSNVKETDDEFASNSSSTTPQITGVFYMNGTTDYIEIYLRLVGTSPTISSSLQETNFTGFKLIT